MRKRNPDMKCPICGKLFHHLGYARHRAMHRNRSKELSMVSAGCGK